MKLGKSLVRGKIYGMTIGLALCASPALAEMCSFTLECFEGEACSETAFDIEIEGQTLVTDAETIPVEISGSETLGVFTGNTGSAIHVLTRERHGDARYSTHIFDGPLMVNYLGSCQ
ncbi:MAG: hypothetical protein ABJ327_17795 [Litoreibacter sp.]